MGACELFPRTVTGRHTASQLARSATAAAANYAEGRAAESRKDFVHKLRIALKELNETSVWLQMALSRRFSPHDVAERLLRECTELSRILVRSVQTAEGRNPKDKPNASDN